MATKKTLNIGLIGGGFMGRTHSNGYRRVPNFFPDLAYTPVLKAVCFRNETKAKDTRSHHYPKRHADGGTKTTPVCKECHTYLHSTKK